MAEYFDLLSPAGAPLGVTKARDAVHQDGDWHPSVHIFVVQGEQVLLQRRRYDKESFPGKLDLACTGHVDAGENYQTAALRELQEELHLIATPRDLRFLFTQKLQVDTDFGHGRFISNEHCRVYLLNEQVPLSRLRFQPEEIDELVWVPKDTDITGSDFCIVPEEWEKAMALIFPPRQT